MTRFASREFTAGIIAVPSCYCGKTRLSFFVKKARFFDQICSLART